MTTTTARREPPSVLAPLVGEIPTELLAIPAWVLWKYDWRKTGWSKVPYRPDGSQPARTNDPTTWGRFEEAHSRYLAGGFCGLGFVLATRAGLLGVDLDACRQPDSGGLTDYARAILIRLNAYCEVSPSGTGVKAYLHARRPEGGRAVFREGYARAEVYDRLRYFAITGRRLLGFPDWVPHRQSQIDALYEENFLIPWKKPMTMPYRPARRRDEGDRYRRALQYLAACRPATSGQHGHGATISVANAICWGFDLGEEDGFRLLWNNYNSRCRPPWSERELRHKCHDAINKPIRPRGYLL